jgi:hypothetical protein
MLFLTKAKEINPPAKDLKGQSNCKKFKDEKSAESFKNFLRGKTVISALVLL